MNYIKTLFLTLGSTTFLFANCSYDLNVNFDFSNKTIDVKTKIEDSQKSLQLDTKNFKLSNEKAIKESLNNGANKISFNYKKKINDLNKDYIYLLSNWYPKLETNCSYTISTNLPKSYKTIYENTNKEIDNFNFIASKNFKISIKKYNDITIKTYFLRNNDELVKKYIDKTIEYIKLYEKRIGKYPYNEFKIVENIHQTGYSMPTFTLIGSRLLEKDYILNQSLGHEILHQYFGNSVFNDFDKGNWTEGLTTFLADDYYKKLNNTDSKNRKLILNQYQNFVNTNNDFPIKDFKYRYDKPSSLIGYSKASFVFHILEKKIGEKEFNKLIKKFYNSYKFKEANLSDIASFFEQNTKTDLKDFFVQWFSKKGQIDFKIEKLQNYYDKDGFWLEFTINQDEKNFFKFDMPIVINTYEGNMNKNITISEAKQSVKLNFSSEILDFTIDKNYDLFRKLSKKEKFPAISKLMSDKSLIAIVNKNDSKKYKHINKVFPNAKIVYSEDIKFKDLKDNSIVFLGQNNTLLPQFYPNIDMDKKNSYLIVKPHIYNNKKAMSLLNFGEYKSRYLMMLKHFSQYSKIILSKDKTEKIIDNSDNGIKIELNKIPTISKVEKKDTLNNIFEELKDKKIVYVGESHTSFEHHLNQLRVIKALHQNGKNISIAMEMFQAPFQKDLDEYIAGKTSLDKFLKNTQYYKRWKFDYNLYKPIIDYAKENKIPLVAINIDREINRQVSKKGLLSLDAKQKKVAPKEIDQSNLEYKRNLENTYKSHIPVHGKSKMNFDFFYQSQLIWDEIMSQNIDNYIKSNPDKTVVVVAGSGHIEKHHGIVSRVFRRNSLPFQVIINNPHASKIGDIVLLNKTKTSLPKEKKVGVVLENEKDLTVIKIIEDSYASKIGIKKQDKIIKLNGKDISTIEEIKIALYFLDDINDLTITVKRKNKIIDLKFYM